MTIWLNEDSRIIVQGITGSEGTKHTRLMAAAGSPVLGGVTPGKGGHRLPVPGRELPVFDTVREAVEAVGANTSVVFVPPARTYQAVMEAVGAGIGLVVCVTEGVPVQDSSRFVEAALDAGTRLIGPNCPGIISPSVANAGIIPANIIGPGRIGLVSKSGTLTYQLMKELSDLGMSTAVGIGGDPVVGTTHIEALAAFEADPQTEAIVLIGEIGGDAEERAAAFIADHVSKPVVGYVAGFTAPEGRTMGHAGAIVSGSSGTARAKKAALEAAGVRVGRTPSETARLMREVVQSLPEQVS
ncbi:succinyl-CoA synthetase alpha subunit [Propionibacterium cyclohexanicum]|uniref:Succinate--CoA ligase [ADP-forming] subunit alpha n=1 Tax=Propionibacterium cyclohexanicum TaxID=64702 RepID=A0A1H9QHV1_9ACTN|nr:succinate--CoA ligase subunit alpha [Propionibacterium cyclohexanicum]SER59997.1 succinyl-CoA synthetase alpha subunit [Propionibacterium cyclohexanicum]